ncbi:prenyltransferase/squalene oxidase repeat-containing protein [Inediibacterium massiliense]|uniref:prenyltransferase/squalene oxidase repeat-containing protein n=1 Tax=Inediibacterium massiliense TaxID=1658111 RepID=UPI0006B54058|nr:Ig-like domain-containing protein [Inediibacterium massiliense]
MNKKLLSLVLVFTMLLGILPLSSMMAHAEGSQYKEELKVVDQVYGENKNVEKECEENLSKVMTMDQTNEKEEWIHVRIEGCKDTLYDEKIKFTKDMKNPLDVLKAAVKEENIQGTNNPSTGFFITEILGESQKENFGWCYYVHFNSGDIIFPSIGVEQFDGLTNLNGELNCKELVFYMCSYSGTSIITKIPVITVKQDGIHFTIKVVDNQVGNAPIKNVDIKVGTKGNYQTDENGEVTFSLPKAGTYQVDISKDQDYPAIVRQHIQIESEGKDSEGLQDIINELKEMYKDKEDLKAIEVMAYNHLMSGEKDYKKVFKISNKKDAAAYAENIMGCLATGQNPKEYVDLLVASQDESGKFIVKSRDKKLVTALADSIVALDMAKGKYDVQKAVKALMDEAKDGYYKDAVDTAYALKALVKHKDIEGVESIIQSSIQYLKNNQLEKGGYDAFGMGNSPHATGPVIQGLVLVQEDILSDSFKKGNRTLVDSLLACKLKDKGFEFAEGKGSGYDDPTATQFAFAALVDIFNGESMYEKFSIKDGNTQKNYEKMIQEAIDGIRDYLTSMETRMDSKYETQPAFYRPLEALGMNVTSKNIQEDVEDLANKVQLNKNQGTLPYVMNSIGLISSGQGANQYLELLKEGQQADGSFKIGRVKQTEWAVIALDMAQKEYDKQKAVECIMKNNKDQEDISLLSVALTALASHKNIDGVEEFIHSKLDYIKQQQLDTGGFEMLDMMSREKVESSVPTAYVISALVANGIDPLTDSEWIKGENTLIDALLKFKKLNYFVCNQGKSAEYFYKDEATEQAFIALADVINKKSSYQNVQKATSYKGIIKDATLKLRNYLTTTQTRKNSSLKDVPIFYSSQEALALYYMSNEKEKDVKDIQQKYKLNNKDDVLSYSQDIMGIIASGQNPKKYKDKNYVQELMNLQNEEGKFVEKGKDSNVYKQSYAIIALDLAQEEYDEKKAITALINMKDQDHFEDVEETAWALIALSKHKDIKGVSELVDSAIQYLKSNQSENGGFDMGGCGDTPQYTGLVIQALMANDIDPMSKEWMKGDKNLVTSMLHDQMEDGTFRACEMMGDYVDIPSTERAFAALSDLYMGKSMYKNIEPVLDDSDILKKTIKELKDYYKKDNKYNYIQAMALNLAGLDKSELQNQLELREDEAKRTYIVLDNETEMYAKNIMGIIGSGEDPRNYKGKNYVEALEKSQNKDGIFNIDGNNVGTQAYSMIALDMADGTYDVQKAIEVLTSEYEKLKNPSVYTTSEVLIALSFHKDLEHVNSKIDMYVKDLKEMQIDTGGFDYNKGSISSDPHEVSEYDAIALQAMIAAGKDPFSEEFKKNGKTVLDGMMAFKKDDHFVYDIQKSSYKEYTDSATGMVLAALIDVDTQKSMYHTLKIKYEQKPIEENSNQEKIKDAIQDLRKYYEKKDQFTFRETIAYHYSSDKIYEDIKKIQQKYKIRENPAQASDYASNIIGLIAAGKNPRNAYGKNYVQELTNYQKENGIFEVKAEGTYPTQTAFSMIALDMADAQYQVQKAVTALMSFQKSDGSFGDIDTTAMSIMALGKHKNIEGVKNCIDQGVSYIHKQQQDTGGFVAWGQNNPYTTAAVIQGLIAVGENPLQEKWVKNGKNMLDFLLSFKVEDHFENKSEYGSEINSVTEQCFMALADLYKGKSMYHELRMIDVEPTRISKIEIQKPNINALKVNNTLKLHVKIWDEENKEIITEKIEWKSLDEKIATIDEAGVVRGIQEGKVSITAKVVGNEKIQDTIELKVEALPMKNFDITKIGEEVFKNGKEAKVQVKVKNNGENNQNVTLIIALYNQDNGKMINYSYVIENINQGESKDLIGGFLVPQNGNYQVKSFVWDNFEDQNILLINPFVVEVQK